MRGVKTQSKPLPVCHNDRAGLCVERHGHPRDLVVVRWIRSEAKTKILATVGRANRYPYPGTVAATET